MTRTRHRRQVRTRLPQTHGADRPTAQHRLGDHSHVTEESAVATDRHLVQRGNQQAIAPSLRHIAAICGEIEAIRYRRPVDDFRIEGRRRVAAYIAEVFCPHMTRLQIETAAETLIEFGL